MKFVKKNEKIDKIAVKMSKKIKITESTLQDRPGGAFGAPRGRKLGDKCPGPSEKPREPTLWRGVGGRFPPL